MKNINPLGLFDDHFLVEHLFGFVENSMHGSIIRTIGITRAKAKIGMIHPVK